MTHVILTSLLRFLHQRQMGLRRINPTELRLERLKKQLFLKQQEQLNQRRRASLGLQLIQQCVCWKHLAKELYNRLHRAYQLVCLQQKLHVKSKAVTLQKTLGLLRSKLKRFLWVKLWLQQLDKQFHLYWVHLLTRLSSTKTLTCLMTSNVTRHSAMNGLVCLHLAVLTQRLLRLALKVLALLFVQGQRKQLDQRRL